MKIDETDPLSEILKRFKDKYIVLHVIILYEQEF